MTPPVLPGEVWRGDVDGDPSAVTVTDGDKARAWYWRDGWQRLEYAHAADAFAAWALSLRAALVTITTDRDHLAAEQRAIHAALGAGPRERPEDAAVRVRAEAQGAAERMREACAAEADAIPPTWNEAAYNHARNIAAAIRALPIPAPTSTPPCSCPDRIAAGSPTRGDRGGPWRHCPWCARPLPDEAASLHVPGCARVEAEGVGHPGACAEPVAANDRGKL